MDIFSQILTNSEFTFFLKKIMGCLIKSFFLQLKLQSERMSVIFINDIFNISMGLFYLYSASNQLEDAQFGTISFNFESSNNGSSSIQN